ncbi:hypothetical protein [Cellulomonas bogoriensis]|uniref:Uncharacterized protein n=1 Tax=Cellulomonas bogoriensis 69B4 = DSM 16987 TaxID=1386082 RepID=A0A0A0BK22_9CELL|nr:hypothetical protein [Cellulomonas bogoriensis]KGM08863.1 hypothetical protein N869_09535 [Cellulomonas bogoriensis 69B4 = DSM 16987]
MSTMTVVELTDPTPPVTGLSLVRDEAVAMPVPCAARPSTKFVHLDGPCACFFGGPAPEFPEVTPLTRPHLTLT